MFEDKLRGQIVDEAEETIICQDRADGDDVRAKVELLWQIIEQYRHLEASIHNLNSAKNDLRQNAPEIAEELQTYLGSDEEITTAKSTLTENINRHLQDLTPEIVQNAVRSGEISDAQADQLAQFRIRWQREQELLSLREVSPERENDQERD